MGAKWGAATVVHKPALHRGKPGGDIPRADTAGLGPQGDPSDRLGPTAAIEEPVDEAPDEAEDVLEAWFAAAPADPKDGWTRAELEAHVRDEHSTFSWLLEPMLERAGFAIADVWYAESRTYARYVCTRR